MTREAPARADFNRYRDSYRDAVQDSLALPGAEVEYFVRAKAGRLTELAGAVGAPGDLDVLDVGVFKHNPWNPLTWLSVHRCEFDDGVLLLTRVRAKRLLEAGGMDVEDSSYIAVFPLLEAGARSRRAAPPAFPGRGPVRRRHAQAEGGRRLMPDPAAEPTPTYSWVIPLLNEEDVLPELHRRLSETAAKLDGPSEFILVDDGSVDRSREVVLQLRDRDPRLKLVALSRNFGHQLAITAGIDVARGDAVVVMDSDLQDPPEVVVEMAARWREGFDLVHGVRTARRGERAFKRHTAHLFYRLLNRASDVDLPLDTGDFRLLDRRVADVVRRMREPSRYLRGLFAWVGFRQTGVPYERDERYAGDTKFSLMRMLSFAVDGLIGFSTVPLRLALGLGFAISALAFAAGLAAIVLKLTGAYTISGWASVTVMITFFSGVQLLMLGAVGQYVGRIFEQGKARPLYLIAETHGIEEPAGATGPGPGTTAAARGQER